MKTKLLSILAGATLSVAALSGNVLYAAETSGMSLSSMGKVSCEDWSFNEQGCAAYIDSKLASESGKAAFGTPSSVMPMSTEKSSCADWSYNDSGCPAYIERTSFAAGKAAYGMPSEEGGIMSGRALMSCEDWSYNDSNCPAYIK